jgi:Ni2+-binding GTPase involved in maturation of urease and hydrogenase
MNIYLVNGFLGSGKTTAIIHACKQLSHQKIKTAVITNDQGEQQVDSSYIKNLSLPTGEVTNGCFCCRYHELEQIVTTLTIKEQPEIIFAESVGSCTDLVATVLKPFTLYNKGVRMIISVFADAYLMYSIMKGTSCFIEEAVQYIYRKQLEEADIIVVNKTDLLNKSELQYIKEVIAISYPNKKTIYQDAYNENDIRKWIQLLNEFSIPVQRNSLELDYNIYGAGEAMLAWFDQKVSVHTGEPVAVKASMILIDNIYKKIQEAGYTIGHLKFLVSDGEWHKKYSYTTMVTEDCFAATELHRSNHLDILINARVQTTPQLLQQVIELAIEETINQINCRIATHQSSVFQPGYPKPLHRITE